MCDPFPPQIRILLSIWSLWKTSCNFLAVLLAPTEASPAEVGHLMAPGTT